MRHARDIKSTLQFEIFLDSSILSALPEPWDRRRV
jgi:hypothetical protein